MRPERRTPAVKLDPDNIQKTVLSVRTKADKSDNLPDRNLKEISTPNKSSDAKKRKRICTVIDSKVKTFDYHRRYISDNKSKKTNNSLSNDSCKHIEYHEKISGKLFDHSNSKYIQNSKLSTSINKINRSMSIQCNQRHDPDSNCRSETNNLVKYTKKLNDDHEEKHINTAADLYDMNMTSKYTLPTKPMHQKAAINLELQSIIKNVQSEQETDQNKNLPNSYLSTVKSNLTFGLSRYITPHLMLSDPQSSPNIMPNSLIETTESTNDPFFPRNTISYEPHTANLHDQTPELCTLPFPTSRIVHDFKETVKLPDNDSTDYSNHVELRKNHFSQLDPNISYQRQTEHGHYYDCFNNNEYNHNKSVKPNCYKRKDNIDQLIPQIYDHYHDRKEQIVHNLSTKTKISNYNQEFVDPPIQQDLSHSTPSYESDHDTKITHLLCHTKQNYPSTSGQVQHTFKLPKSIPKHSLLNAPKSVINDNVSSDRKNKIPTFNEMDEDFIADEKVNDKNIIPTFNQLDNDFSIGNYTKNNTNIIPTFTEMAQDDPSLFSHSFLSRSTDKKWSHDSAHSTPSPKKPSPNKSRYTGKPRSSNLSPMPKVEKVSRMLTGICRHKNQSASLLMLDGGYFFVEEILNTPAFKRLSVTTTEIQEIVRNNDKQRFSLKELDGNLMICANQGHSIEIQGLELEAVLSADSNPTVVHGTYEEAWCFIQQQGLKRMNRNHIHFAAGLPSNRHVISGMRSDCEILIYIDLEKALQDGLKFYKSKNNVILCEGDNNGILLPKYFKSVRKVPGHKELLDKNTRAIRDHTQYPSSTFDSIAARYDDNSGDRRHSVDKYPISAADLSGNWRAR